MATLGTPSVKPLIKTESRIATFDLARGVLIILMVLIHVLDFYGNDEVRFGVFGTAIKWAASWQVAAWFVFIMGVFVTYSEQGALSKGLMRALNLFALGYLLNFARGAVPLWLSLKMDLVTPEQMGLITPITELLIVDILQFAGLALACCLLVKHYFPRTIYWLGCALIVMSVSPYLWDFSTDLGALNELIKLFVGNKSQGAMFPLFPWLAYPLAGMAFGYWLKKSKRIQSLFDLFLVIGVTLVSIGVLITLNDPQYHIASNMRSGMGLIICLTGGALVFLWACQYLVNSIPPNRCFELLYFWGNNVTSYYIIQWILIGWGLMLFQAQQLALTHTLLAMFGVMVLSHYLLRVWLWCTNANKKVWKYEPQG